jgi:hypothetical protein
MVSLPTMVRFAAAFMSALVLSACGSSIALPLGTPTPSAQGANSAAADLRTHVDVLFGEHTFAIAKLSVAAAAGRKDEFRSYAGLLAANSADVTALMRSALGQTEGTRFGQAWTAGNNFYVDYLVAEVTHDQPRANAAMSNLTTTYVPQLTQVLTASLPLSTEQATPVAADQVSTFQKIVDDAVGSAFTALYPDLRDAYVKAVRGGDLVAIAIASRFADRFPGNAMSKSADFRGVVDTLLMEQAYLLTMESDATVAGTKAELAAATDAVTANTKALVAVFAGIFGDAASVQFGAVWDNVSLLLVAYAKSGSANIRRNVIDTGALPMGTGQSFEPDFTNELTTMLQAVDDQRGKSFDKLGDDDRAAAAQLAAVGDSVTVAAVRQAPSKFA